MPCVGLCKGCQCLCARHWRRVRDAPERCNGQRANPESKSAHRVPRSQWLRQMYRREAVDAKNRSGVHSVQRSSARSGWRVLEPPISLPKTGNSLCPAASYGDPSARAGGHVYRPSVALSKISRPDSLTVQEPIGLALPLSRNKASCSTALCRGSLSLTYFGRQAGARCRPGVDCRSARLLRIGLQVIASAATTAARRRLGLRRRSSGGQVNQNEDVSRKEHTRFHRVRPKGWPSKLDG